MSRLSKQQCELRTLWNVLIVPHCSPYDKGAFRIERIIPYDYPFIPLKILFQTKIYHPKVDEEGYIHLEILSKYWSPSTQIEQVFRCLIAVVNKPYHISVKSEVEFFKKAMEMTENFSERRPDDTDRPLPKEVGKIANRLRIELEEIKAANVKCFEKIRVNDIWTWNGLLVPDCAPYNKGDFRFEVNIPPEYPHASPKIYFRTKIYHPNVNDSGEVDMRETCIEWNSTRKMIDVFQVLR
nr:ubiquitin-conjugating enzyme E2 L3-like [Parasteatoda tepidariorum]